MSNNKPIVEIVDLTRVFGDSEKIRALDGVTMQVRRGEIMAIVGPSGSGKSTLLHLLGALDRPTGGRIIIDGQDLAEVKNLDRFRNETVGFVFQLHNLIPTLTALENVEVPLFEQRISAKNRHRKAKEMLELVGLGDRIKHQPGKLSGGQRQRVAIARALVNDPALVLADEPTGELDSQNTTEIMQIMLRLNRELGTTIIVVTHDPAVARETNRIVELDSGRIVRTHEVGNPFEEDWKVLRDSGLGQALLKGQTLNLSVDGKTLIKNGQFTAGGHQLHDLLLQNES